MSTLSSRFDLMPIWAKWTMTVACVAVTIGILGTGFAGRNELDEFGSPAGMVSPEWFHFFFTVLLAGAVVLILGIFLFLGRMTWVLNRAANIEQQRRFELERERAAQFQGNVDGPVER